MKGGGGQENAIARARVYVIACLCVCLCERDGHSGGGKDRGRERAASVASYHNDGLVCGTYAPTGQVLEAAGDLGRDRFQLVARHVAVLWGRAIHTFAALHYSLEAFFCLRRHFLVGEFDAVDGGKRVCRQLCGRGCGRG